MKIRWVSVLVAFVLAVAATACGEGPAKQSAGGSVHPPGWGRPAPVSERLFAVAPGTTAAMFDTITLGTVPSNPFALAGYTAGHWPTFLPLRKAWPLAHTVSIAIRASDHADCLDVEPGDASPGQVAGWVWADRRAGFAKPCLYSSWWEFHDEVRPALARAGIKRWEVWEWSADYTYRPHIDRGFDATQWTDKAFGRNLDQSLVLRSFLSIAHPPLRPPPHPTPKPKPKPKPRPKPSKLATLIAERERTRRHLLNAGCRVKHPRPACLPLFAHGRRENIEIRALGGH